MYCPAATLTNGSPPPRRANFTLLCSQYCGTQHSRMTGHVIVMEPADYDRWLEAVPAMPTREAAGLQLFKNFSCDTCHGQRAPTLAGLYMSKVPLDDGRTVIADDDYLRESIPSIRKPSSSLAMATSCPATAINSAKNKSWISWPTSSRFAPRTRSHAHDARADLLSTPAPPPLERVPSYLEDGRTLRSWLLTTDHKRIAILYLLSITFFFSIGGVAATMTFRLSLVVLPPATWSPMKSTTSASSRSAWRDHGLVLSDPLHSDGAGQLPAADDDRGPRPGFPQAQFAFVVPLRLRRPLHPGLADRRRCGYGVDVLPPYSTTYSNTWVVLVVTGVFIAGFSSILTGLNFIISLHTMRLHPGLHVVSACRCSCGPLMPRRSSSCWPRRSSHACITLMLSSPPNAFSAWAFSIQFLAAILFSSSISSGSTRTPPFTS